MKPSQIRTAMKLKGKARANYIELACPNTEAGTKRLLSAIINHEPDKKGKQK
jgi:hypothetical protein